MRIRTSPSRTWHAVAAYLAFVVAILAARPGYAFHPDGKMKQFGTGAGKSVFSFGTLTGGAAVLSGSVFAAGDLLFAS